VVAPLPVTAASCDPARRARGPGAASLQAEAAIE